MIRFAIAFLIFAMAFGQGTRVSAAPVKVTSGEHEGFTRLVFDFGKVVDWTLGRNADGYHLRVSDGTQVYNLTETFDLIGRSRLAAIWMEPESGDLRIGLACACHAIPFEFRPGIIVVDLKDGPPPKGTAFELTMDGTTAPPLAARPLVRPRPRPADRNTTAAKGASYDWTMDAYRNLRSSDSNGEAIAPRAKTGAIQDPNMQPLRDEILFQMALGAAQGTVDFAPPDGLALSAPEASFPSAQIRIGEAKTSVSENDSSIHADLGARGATCLSPDQLQLGSWGDENLPILDQIARFRKGLSGEFDRSDPANVAAAVKFQLFLGFGAEARQLASAFELPKEDSRIWIALSYLIDGEADPTGAFAGQSACEGPVALWAVMADDHLQPGDPIATGSLRLAFSALPRHLRHQIGPPLAERLTTLGHPQTARALSDTLNRAPGADADETRLLAASLALKDGDPARAEKIAAEILSTSGPNHVEALITLAEARASQGLPVVPEVALALQSHLRDHAGSELASRLQAALLVAQAASGDFAAAFEGLKRDRTREPDVWALMAALAPDEVFLNFAVRDEAEELPDLPGETLSAIARRLTEMGMANPASRWLAASRNKDPLLAAEVALRQADGQSALVQLGSAADERAKSLRRQALELLRDDRALADFLADGEDRDAASAALARAGNWAQLAQTGTEPWRTVAARLSATPKTAAEPSETYGPLARGQELADAGQETRDAIDDLLTIIVAPSPSQ
jgi:hypothetical protein